MREGILVRLKEGGDTIFRSRRVSDRVSCGMDTKIPAKGPESRSTRISKQTFSANPQRYAWGGNSRNQYATRPHSCTDDYTAKIRSERRDRKNKRSKCEQAEEKVCLVGEGILERERCLVARIFRVDGRAQRKPNNQIRTLARESGFRSSEA